MARINVEQKALTDSRFAHLGILIQGKNSVEYLSPGPLGLGVMIHVWNECQEREAHALPSISVDSLGWNMGIQERLSQFLVGADLGELVMEGENEFIRIRGTTGRIEWLALVRNKGKEGGKNGGRPRKEPLGDSEDKTPGGISWKTPPAPSPPQRGEGAARPRDPSKGSAARSNRSKTRKTRSYNSSSTEDQSEIEDAYPRPIENRLLTPDELRAEFYAGGITAEQLTRALKLLEEATEKAHVEGAP